MEGIVAKRTLKKSYYNNKNLGSIGFESATFNRTKENSKNNKGKLKKYKEKIIFKICIQSISMMSIMAFVLGIKLLNISVVIESDIAQKTVAYYKKTYSVGQIIDGSKELVKYIYVLAKPVIPEQVENKVKELYRAVLTYKKTNENEKYNNKENEVVIYEESSIINKENTVKENVGVSVEDAENAEKIVSVSSSVSSQSSIVEEIKETKVEFVKPVSGTITSVFGAREVIFEGIDSYHTGTDIAAKTGTKVVSSIKGKVTRATYNKYNGNFVEVTNGDIATIYCHLSKISVKVGDTVKAGTKIGEVGSTGLSTGPHLHFEVVYDGTKIDPELILDL